MSSGKVQPVDRANSRDVGRPRDSGISSPPLPPTGQFNSKTSSPFPASQLPGSTGLTTSPLCPHTFARGWEQLLVLGCSSAPLMESHHAIVTRGAQGVGRLLGQSSAPVSTRWGA